MLFKLSSTKQNIYKSYTNLSQISKVLMALSFLLLVIIAFKQANNNSNLLHEGFSDINKHQIEKFVSKVDEEVYDDFYTSIYDSLLFSDVKNNFEINKIVSLINTSSTPGSAVVLDVGSGTGHHVASLYKKGIKNIVGIDFSLSMVKQARENYPQYTFAHKNALNSMAVTSNTFSHILCLYFTIYYFKNKSVFFNNAMNWLLPGGYLVIHLVDKDMFDPILPPGNPLHIVSPQKYAPKRITHTNIKFKGFEYYSNFIPEDGTHRCTFKETLNFNNGQKRINEHNFTMEPRNEIVQMANSAGFILKKIIDLIECSYTNQYLYVFQKPN
jgi:ubiquinone/menaquinone biosynthesis C-methylase UbiE